MSGLRQEWAGIPLPIEGEQLVIEPSHPLAAILGEIGKRKDEEPPPGIQIRNNFYSHRHRCTIIVYEKDGKIRYCIEPGIHNLRQQIHTLGCSFAWGVEQEAKAIQTLGTLVRHVAFKQYMLTGMFIERSKRSGLSYIFRRLRPTVALTKHPQRDEMRILCSLCMHPIAYYADTWAGAMCPTDDIIAHVMLMRADEPMFWRRCSQHQPHLPQAGL